MDSSFQEQDSSWAPKQDMSLLCRVCANQQDYLIPIFEGEGLDHDMPTKMQKYLPVKVRETDKLPIQMCYQCASTIIAWSDLVTNCLEADKKLKGMLKINEKNAERKETESTLDDDTYDDSTHFDDTGDVGGGDDASDEDFEKEIKQLISDAGVELPSTSKNTRSTRKRKAEIVSKKSDTKRSKSDTSKAGLLKPKEEVQSGGEDRGDTPKKSPTAAEVLSKASKIIDEFETNEQYMTRMGFGNVFPKNIKVEKPLESYTNYVTINLSKEENLKYAKINLKNMVRLSLEQNKNVQENKTEITEHPILPDQDASKSSDSKTTIRSNANKIAISRLKKKTIDVSATNVAPKLIILPSMPTKLKKPYLVTNKPTTLKQFNIANRNLEVENPNSSDQPSKDSPNNFIPKSSLIILKKQMTIQETGKSGNILSKGILLQNPKIVQRNVVKASNVKNMEITKNKSIISSKKSDNKYNNTEVHLDPKNKINIQSGSVCTSSISGSGHVKFVRFADVPELVTRKHNVSTAENIQPVSEAIAGALSMTVKPNLSTSSSLRNKKQNKLKGRLFSCSNCLQMFSTYDLLQEHIKTHEQVEKITLNERNLFNCCYCSEVFYRKVIYHEHIKEKHGQNILNIKQKRKFMLCACEECGKMFYNKFALKTHLTNVHVTGDSNYQCHHCMKTFKSKKYMGQHIRSIHLKQTNTISSEKKRQKSDSTSSTNSPIKCNQCNKTYQSYTQFKGHRATCSLYLKTVDETQSTTKKTIEKDSDVPVTTLDDKKYILTGDTAKKIMTKSKTTSTESKQINKPQYKCETCNKIFKERRYYQKHIQYIHDNEPRNTSKPKVCEICGAHVKQMNAHMRTHADERSHMCIECGLSFKFKNHLMQHSRIHSGNKPYVCPICDKSFTLSGDMYKHAQAVHLFTVPRKNRTAKISSVIKE